MRVNHILLSHKTVGVLFSTVKENPNKIIRKYPPVANSIVKGFKVRNPGGAYRHLIPRSASFDLL